MLGEHLRLALGQQGDNIPLELRHRLRHRGPQILAPLGQQVRIRLLFLLIG
jgi:hypothetical protein